MSLSYNNNFFRDDEPWDDDLGNVFEEKQLTKETETTKPKRRARTRQLPEVTTQVLSAPANNVKPTDITDAVRHSFISYAMSVIIARALPDARDGLKPVHRRILYAMFLLGLEWNRPHKKSARIVGETLGRFHPHGDGPTYGAMTRMVQPFLMRYPLVDGHGNFGSIDGDPPAAMRYTEARMTKLSSKMVLGITKDAVPMALNYDASEKEPTVLPARFPNLLVSGSTGIAVGMATNIPPHNIKEVINGVVAYAENPSITNEELMTHIPGPDFPTGALILGTKGIKSAYTTGNGSLTIRSQTHFEHTSNKTMIVVTEIPYMINKANMVKKIAALAKDKVVEGISGLRDESNQKGIRVVIEVKRGHVPEIVLNKLFKYSPLQSHFGVNMLALDKGEPKVLTLKDAIRAYFDHQKQVVTRVTQFDLKKTQHRLHILEGLRVAVQNIDAVIKIIRNAPNINTAQANLRNTYGLSKVQSEAITSMQLGRLTNLAIKTMNEEIVSLENTAHKLNTILTDSQVLTRVITQDLTAIKDLFADRRRTKIVAGSVGNISEEDLIPQRDIAITLSRKGFVKRIDLAQYRAQRRGGVGATSAKTYEDDDVLSIVTTTTHTDILVFTASARVYRLRAYQIPEMSKQAKGQHFVNLVNIKKGDSVISLLPVEKYDDNLFLVTVTKRGIVKKTLLADYRLIFTNGKYALKLKEGDALFATMIVQANDELLVGSAQGKVVRFNLNEVRPTARVTSGVKGIRLNGSRDKVVGASVFRHEGNVLSIGTRGFGKMTPVVEYRLTKRGAKGVQTINTRKSGNLVVMSVAHGNEDIIVLTSKGLTIRTNLSQVNTTSRATKGVTIVRLGEGVRIQSLAVIDTQSVESVAQEALEKTQELDITDIRDDALDAEDLTDVDEEG